jgi:hypothetical protein
MGRDLAGGNNEEKDGSARRGEGTRCKNDTPLGTSPGGVGVLLASLSSLGAEGDMK